jgi:transcriptional regulator with XRE-family HTH domain
MDINVFAERLKKLREDKTQNQVAKEMNSLNLSTITQQTLGRYENGDRLPNAEILCDLADYYNVSVDYLLGRADKETGLSGNAINAVKELNKQRETRSYIELLSLLLENNDLAYLLGLMEAYITSGDSKISFTPETLSTVEKPEKAVIKLAISDEIHDILDYIKPIFLNNSVPTEIKMIQFSYKKGLISESEKNKEIDNFYRRFYNG